jgi:hypothetical protein
VVMAGAAAIRLGSAHAEPQPAFDRNLVEHLVRAEESQARALEALNRTLERCQR